MTGRRRLGMKPATATVTVVATETPHADTQVIDVSGPAFTPAELLSAQPDGPDLTGPLVDCEPVTPEEIGSWADYVREPVPDLDSPDPADRTEWLRLHEGDETDFAAILNDHPEWLYLVGLPEPGATGSEEVPDGERVSPSVPDSGSGSAPPVDAAAETTPASADPEPVSSENEPVQDEPAEPDCAEGADK